MAKIDLNYDLTLKEVDKILEKENLKQKSRNYLGMSGIGDECKRLTWYRFRQASARIISASGLKAIQDGFAQEDVMSERLKKLSYIELITEERGEQIGYDDHKGHFSGHLDGVIRGILEAPKSYHIWEHKSVNEKKFAKIAKLRDKVGEKGVLIEWDYTYYIQAVLYMHYAGLERHYLTVSTPGGRDYTSIRTECNEQSAQLYIDFAKSIIFDNSIPAKISNKPEFYKCGWCEMAGVCHSGDFPAVNCKTCMHIECIENAQYKCNKHDMVKDDIKPCKEHIYIPSIIPAEYHSQSGDYSIYKTDKDVFFANCPKSEFIEIETDIVDVHIIDSDTLYNKIKNVNNFDVEDVRKAFDGEIINDGLADIVTMPH